MVSPSIICYSVGSLSHRVASVVGVRACHCLGVFLVAGSLYSIIALSRFQCSIQTSYCFASCHQINDRHRRGRHKALVRRVVMGVEVVAQRRRQPASQYPFANFVEKSKIWASAKHAIITRWDRRSLW